LVLHPDKNNSSSEGFQQLQDAYNALISIHDKSKISHSAQKAKKNAEISERISKLRQELLEKESKVIINVPKKRPAREPSPEPPKLIYNGVKATWKTNSIYTEDILTQIFKEFGTVQKILVKQKKAYVIYSNIMACVKFIQDRVIANPPILFRAKRISDEKCKKILSIKPQHEPPNPKLADKISLLKTKLNEKRKLGTINDLI
jgi:hypothetical protein